MSSEAHVKFQSVISRIQDRFPNLEGEFTDPSPAVDLAYEMRAQSGLQADVLLNLQNEDEFHLCIGLHFWDEWFPCLAEGVSEEYLEMICGFISGTHRVVDYYRGTGCWKSVLQVDSQNRWKTVSLSRHIGGGSWSWSKRSQKIITNREQGGGGQPDTR